ncbi:hypothetical protein XbC2_451 [Xanthomonas phage XbC2]|nr:hypothetical protein XbC2_451 [Xanthomonas phage XbC2]
MKHFFEVLLVAVTILLFAFGQTGLAIFAGALTVIVWLKPSYNTKSVEQIIAEANGAAPSGTEAVYVEYNFVSEPTEKFTASLYHYSNGPLTEEAILPKLAEYVTEHTGIPIEAERLHITKIQAV